MRKDGRLFTENKFKNKKNNLVLLHCIISIILFFVRSNSFGNKKLESQSSSPKYQIYFCTLLLCNKNSNRVHYIVVEISDSPVPKISIF